MTILVCYNPKVTNIYIYVFNQNQNFIKNVIHNFLDIRTIKREERRVRECLSFH